MPGLVDTNLDPFHYYYYGPNRIAPQIFDLEGEEEQRRGQVLQRDTPEDCAHPRPAQEPTAEDLRRFAEGDAILRAVRAAGGDFSRFSAAQLADISMCALTRREYQSLLADYNRRKATGQWGPAPAPNRHGPAKAAQKPPRRGFWRGFVDAMRSDPGAP